MSLREQVLDALNKEPTLTNKQLYNLFPDGNKTSIRVYANESRNGSNKLDGDITPVIINTKSTTKQPIDHSSTQERTQFIDDPDELLMSVAIRELNKSNPDPRWATILINCKKENIAVKDEVIDQLQQLPTRNLTEILQKQHIKSWQTE